MTIKQQGGVFGRNPSFNDVEMNDLDANIGLFNRLGVNVTGTTARPVEFNTAVRIADGAVIEWGGITANIAGSSVSNTLFFRTGGSETGRFDSLKNLDLTYGGGNVMLASGAGIDFSATSGTGTSELFDDYEEGTWTPDLLFGGAKVGLTLATQTGTYTKVGDVVTAVCSIKLSAKGSSTGNATIAGLPYSVSGEGGSAIGYFASFGTLTGMPTVRAAFSALEIRYRSSGNLANMTDAQFTDTTDLRFVSVYKTA